MPRAVCSRAISFGLVNVPVKVYRAQAPKDIRFHQLHDKAGAPRERGEAKVEAAPKGSSAGGGRKGRR